MSLVLQPTSRTVLDFGAPDESRLSEIMAQPLDWERLVDLARAEGMLLPLSAGLSRHPGAVTPKVLEDVRGKAAAKVRRSLWMAGELTRLFRLFGAAGIHAIAFKGPALGHLAYGSVGLRDSNDLDIYVHRPQLEAVLDLLAREGYRKKSEAWSIHLSGACEIALQRRQPDCEVDLHWEFSSPYFLHLDAERLAARSMVVSTAGFSARTLCPEDHLIYVCVHAARESWGLARFVSDIAGIVSRCSLDWDDVQREAARARCWRVVAIGLALAAECLDAPVPPKILDRIRRDKAATRMTAQVLENLGRSRGNRSGTPDGAMLHLGMIESFAGKAAYLWRRALLPTQLDREFLRIPESFTAAYYLVRPLRVACAALRRLRAQP